MAKRMWGSDEGPTPLDSSLSRILGRLTPQSARSLTDLIDNWSSLVGEEVAAASAPIKVERDTVTVRCDRAAYATYLKVSWPEIRRVAEAAGIATPSAIVVVVRPRGTP